MALAENDTVATFGKAGERVWLYPLRHVGRFVRARTIIAWCLIGFLLVAPWVDIAGHPAMFFDIPHRRFYFWGLTFFATDANYLLFFFGAVFFSIFFFTALLGRVWCGWTCPQTVFLESLIRPIEELLEGPPSQRKKLDAAPMSPNKAARKALKHAVFITVAGMISTTVMAYFMGRGAVLEAQLNPLSHPVGTAFFVSITGLLYFDFAWFREQTCIVVCPYGRLQSVLMDGDSLTIGYDEKRGEPRGRPRDPEAGDCVDCGKCVRVCPTGIDIRKGIQMECVNCAACIDACDDVMTRLKRPTGLIRYTSERALEGEKTRWLRPRVVAYAVAFLGITLAFATAVTLREPVEVAVIRTQGVPFVMLPDGRAQNMMTLRIANKTDSARTFTVRAVTPADAEAMSPMGAVSVAGGGVERFPLLLRRAPASDRDTPFVIRVVDEEGFSTDVETVFLGPGGDI